MTTGTKRISSHDIELGQGPVGCFLIHGFTGSTYELQGLAEFLANQGFRVRAKLLAGHGTTIEECNLVRAHEWLEETEFHLTEFMLEGHTTFLIGLSMGAGLALHLARIFPVAGVVAMSPSLLLDSWKMRWLVPLLAPFVKAMPKARVYGQRDLEKHPYFGYPSYPLRGLRELIKLNKYIRGRLQEVTVPTLVMHSRTDLTAPFENATYVHDTIQSKDKTLIDYSDKSHVLPDGSGKEQVWADILDFLTPIIHEQDHAVPIHEPR